MRHHAFDESSISLRNRSQKVSMCILNSPQRHLQRYSPRFSWVHGESGEERWSVYSWWDGVCCAGFVSCLQNDGEVCSQFSLTGCVLDGLFQLELLLPKMVRWS
jgi:hypothetical protein